MINESRISSSTWHSRVLVLEDHDDEFFCICKALTEDGKQVKAAKTLDQFEDYLKTDTFDASSIDLFINDSFIGPQAMEHVKHYEPDAGTLVYSVRADEPTIEQTMRKVGVDVMVTKFGNNIPEYLLRIEETVRLGLARTIARGLKDAGRLTNQHLRPELLKAPLPLEVETELYRESRRLAIEHAMAGEEHEIVKALRRRGWWRLFDSTHFAQLPVLGQLGQFFGFVEGKPEELSRILGVSDDEALSLLQGETSAISHHQDVSSLMTVLNYVFRLANYEPELMSHYWRAPGLFAEDSSSPPWSSFGMANYLLDKGATGVREASDWICKDDQLTPRATLVEGTAPSEEHASHLEEIEALLGEIEQKTGGALHVVREAIQEESAARRYVTERYRTLIDLKYLQGLSSSESEEVGRLETTLDDMDEPYYDAIIRRLRGLVDQRES